ncbi:2-succinyl-5-enolpyruvyl-6-hydroxy-3-cyclohexene-1-carboxylic-acid synthase [bacterium]|nr:2-succinyl-5-enolpyruvyl-6-hydroxy-3-cyclohexene-1-carboxylic-acid synthase [bacterium]
MEQLPTSLNALWAQIIIEELARLGVRHVCLAPGSRSTPLTLAVDAHPLITAHVHFDERGLGFFALGVSKGLGREPVAVLTTSGTAVANLLPAVIEANQDHVPLLLLTADRPWELQNCGANQTIVQPDIFGAYAECKSLPVPDEQVSLTALLSTVDDAVFQMKRGHKPSHINCPFRGPLSPPKQSSFDPRLLLSELGSWLEGSFPWTQCATLNDPSVESIKTMVIEGLNVKKGLLVVGALDSPEEIEAVHQLGQRLGWPICADILSGLRFKKGPHYRHHYDLKTPFSRNDSWDTIFHVGGRITSKTLQQYLDSSSSNRRIHLSPYSNKQDPDHRLTQRLLAPIVGVCDVIIDLLPPATINGEALIGRDLVMDYAHKIDSRYSVEAPLSEPGVVVHLSKLLMDGGALFLSNSMSIRLMDMLALAGDQTLRVHANRGASGIDGVLATAAGVAQVTQGPTVLLIGDLALLHDLNSLALLRDCTHPFIIVALNNNGGGIFQMLPVKDEKEAFVPYFQTPHGLDFKHAAKQFGVGYEVPRSLKDFASLFAFYHSQPGPVILEVQVPYDQVAKEIQAMRSEQWNKSVDRSSVS